MIEDLLKSVLPELRQMAKAQTVVGDPITAGESTVIPISKVSVGFGGGGGKQGENEGGTGAGGGAMIEPIAFIVVTDGKVQLLPLTSKDTTIGKVIDLVPDILNRVGLKDKKKKSQKSKDVDEDTEDSKTSD
ncbi:MAG: sporulation protein [Candidatus Marinimicrobia bacterium]|nr:sporulation protein [Candidatus Neomarinimicrobiota bacterium]